MNRNRFSFFFNIISGRVLLAFICITWLLLVRLFRLWVGHNVVSDITGNN